MTDLRYTSPTAIADDQTNCGLIYGEPLPKGGLGFPVNVSFSDFSNGILGQFGPASSFTKVVALFCNAVCHVVGVGSEKKMRDFNAGRMVALVANEQSFWNGTVGDLPCDTMGTKGTLFAIDLPSNNSVSVVKPCSSPVATSIGVWNRNTFPKTGQKGIGFVQLAAPWRTVFSTTLPDGRGELVERFLAILTNAVRFVLRHGSLLLSGSCLEPSRRFNVQAVCLFYDQPINKQ